MSSVNDRLARVWSRLGPRFLPFADSASVDLPLGRLLRLSLFQVSVGMSLVLLNGTLNRVMIVEMGLVASVVASMVALPVLLAPLRLLLGYRSDYHRSVLGWRRVPYIWIGTMVQFGGLAIMPFALIVSIWRCRRASISGTFSSSTSLSDGRRRYAHGTDGRSRACE